MEVGVRRYRMTLPLTRCEQKQKSNKEEDTVREVLRT